MRTDHHTFTNKGLALYKHTHTRTQTYTKNDSSLAPSCQVSELSCHMLNSIGPSSWIYVPAPSPQNHLLSFWCLYSAFRSLCRILLPIQAESLEILQAFIQGCGWHFLLGAQIWEWWWLRLSASHYAAFGSWYVVYEWCDHAERERERPNGSLVEW